MKPASHEQLNRARVDGAAEPVDLHRTDNGISLAWIDGASVHHVVMLGRVNGGPLSLCAMRGGAGPVLALGDDRARALRDALTEMLGEG